jgi:molybdopterin-guanine dinucleotide biosynthesis protein A
MNAPKPDRNPILGGILAGGLSRRMGGREKSLIAIAGRPLIAHVIERARPQVGSLVINANGDPGRFAAFGLPVIADTVPGFAGPLAGILALLRHAASGGHEMVAPFPADTPFPAADQVARLLAAAGGGLAIARSAGRLHPLASLIPTRLADDLENFIRDGGTLRVVDWIERHQPVIVEFAAPADATSDPFFNVNTPADLKRAAAIAAMQPLPEPRAP